MNFDVLKGLLPANRKSNMSDDDRLIVMCCDLTFESENGSTLVKRNGQIMRNEISLNPLTPQEAINFYFTERDWLNKTDQNQKVSTLSAFTKKWKEENPSGNELSPEFDMALGKHMKDNPDLDFFN